MGRLDLMPGHLHLTLWRKGPDSTNHDLLENCMTMDVETSDYFGSGRGISAQLGVLFLPARRRAGAGLVTG